MKAGGLVRDPRFQSLIVLAGLVAGALVLVADALLAWRADASALAVYEERTALLEQSASEMGARSSGPTAPDGEQGGVLIDAQTSGLVSAEFQRLLSRRAEETGAIVRAVNVPEEVFEDAEAGPTPDTLERIRLTVDIEVMEQALPDLLYAIEAGVPVMVVDAFTLRLNRSVDALGAFGAAGVDRPLSLSVTLSAFREKEPQS